MVKGRQIVVRNLERRRQLGGRCSRGCLADATSQMRVPNLSRYASAPSAHGGLVGCQRGGSTSVSLCDLVSLGADESDPPGGTENPRVSSSILPLAIP